MEEGKSLVEESWKSFSERFWRFEFSEGYRDEEEGFYFGSRLRVFYEWLGLREEGREKEGRGDFVVFSGLLSGLWFYWL